MINRSGAMAVYLEVGSRQPADLTTWWSEPRSSERQRIKAEKRSGSVHAYAYAL
jgi:uncharacterized cupin superfamily protein